MTRHALQDTSLDESPVCFCAEADTWLTLSPDHEEECTQMLSALAREGRATPAALFSALVLCILFLRRFLTSKVSLKYFDFFLFLGRLNCVVRGRVGGADARSSTEAADADDKLITGAASVAAANAAAGGPVSAAVAGCDADVDATGSSTSGHCDSAAAAAAAAAVDVAGVAGASRSEASAEAKVVPAAAASGCSEALPLAA